LGLPAVKTRVFLSAGTGHAARFANVLANVADGSKPLDLLTVGAPDVKWNLGNFLFQQGPVYISDSPTGTGQTILDTPPNGSLSHLP
jgi:hypothetical protein